MVFWMICKACITYNTVVNIASVHFSRQKVVHALRSFVDSISINVTNNFENWATDDTYVKVNCDDIMFTTDVGWNSINLIVILFRLQEFKYSMC